MWLLGRLDLADEQFAEPGFTVRVHGARAHGPGKHAWDMEAMIIWGQSLSPGGQRPSKTADTGKRSSHPNRRLEEQNKSVQGYKDDLTAHGDHVTRNRRSTIRIRDDGQLGLLAAHCCWGLIIAPNFTWPCYVILKAEPRPLLIRWSAPARSAPSLQFRPRFPLFTFLDNKVQQRRAFISGRALLGRALNFLNLSRFYINPRNGNTNTRVSEVLFCLSTIMRPIIIRRYLATFIERSRPVPRNKVVRVRFAPSPTGDEINNIMYIKLYCHIYCILFLSTIQGVKLKN